MTLPIHTPERPTIGGKSSVRPAGRFGPGWGTRKSKWRIYAVAVKHLLTQIARTFGTGQRNCPVCQKDGQFFAFGLPLRLDAICSRCGSLERHRQIALWLSRNEQHWTGRRVLHFAPDASIQAILRVKAGDYIGADIVPALGCRVLDIEALALDDASVDIIVCSHVLEHVDDTKALLELRRVLTVGGIALIMVPVIHGWTSTYENTAVTTPRQRKQHFGQDDHLRYFGDDIENRITSAGFDVTKLTAQEPDCMTYGLIRGDTLYVATAQ